LASAVIHPAVRRGESRLRLCATAAHSTADIRHALTAFAALAGRVSASATTAPERRARSGLRVVEHIDEIEPAEWDAVVPLHEVQGTHAFVKACQDARVGDAVFRHVVHYTSGRVSGVASFTLMPVRIDLLCPGPLRTIIGTVRRAWHGFLQPSILICGLPVSAGRPCFFHAREHGEEFARAAASYMGALGSELDASILCFKEFSPAESRPLESALREAGYFHANSLPTYRLPLGWSSFGEYQSSMRSSYRHQIASTLRAREADGIAVCRVRGADTDWSRVFALYEQVMDRAEFQLERLSLSFFQRLAEGLGERVETLLLERDGELLAAAILLNAARRCTFFMTGIDYAANLRFGSYIALVTDVVAYAIESGATVLDLGQTSDHLKSRLGAAAEPRSIFFRCRRPLTHDLFRRAAPFLFPAPTTPPRRIFRGNGAHRP
ncbi:MAG: GNAT family N-acetyltransferase, partial [Longimicrobiales bacterium]